MMQMNLFTKWKQTHRLRGRIDGSQGGSVVDRDRLGVLARGPQAPSVVADDTPGEHLGLGWELLLQLLEDEAALCSIFLPGHPLSLSRTVVAPDPVVQPVVFCLISWGGSSPCRYHHQVWTPELSTLTFNLNI